jgi:D-alanyl-D-alanine carboxypeptidase
LQWLRDPSKINRDHHQAFQEYKEGISERDKINKLAINSTNKNIRDLYRGINELKRGYQSRSNLVKDKNADLLAGTHNILNR